MSVPTTDPDLIAAHLGRLAATGTLLVALDFDGTLAPLVDEPMSARAIPAAREAVAALAALPRTEVALVSGRTLADLRVIAEHRDDSPIHLAGSHGAQWWHPGGGGAGDVEADPAERDRLIVRAEALVDGIPGAWIEPKAVGFGAHTRLSTAEDAQRVQRIVDELMATEAPGWRRRSGRDVVEFASRAEGKDSAVAALRVKVGATAVLFAGDDVTDEDALHALGAADLGIRVGEGDTAAHIRVQDAHSLAALLSELARLRREY